jgi:hypothetical protein
MEPRDAATKELVHRALGADDDAPAVADRLLGQLRELPARPRIPRWTDGRRRTGRALGWTSAAVVALLLGNLIAARLVPSYAADLAYAPVIGPITAPLLQFAGLAPSQLAPSSSSATVDGQTIKVEGGFADTSRTVVVIQVDGRNSQLSKTGAGYTVQATLTDQYGHSYSLVNNGEPQDLWFQPLVGPAMHGPVRLTLHVSLLIMYSASSPGSPGTQSRFAGHWSLGLTVTQHPAATEAAPAPVTVGGTTYAVTSITISGTDVSIHWRASGGSQIAQYWSLTRGPGAAESDSGNLALKYFYAAIESPGASLARTNLGSMSPSPIDVSGFVLISPELITGQLQQVVPAPGKYLIAIGRPTVVSFPIAVP